MGDVTPNADRCCGAGRERATAAGHPHRAAKRVGVFAAYMPSRCRGAARMMSSTC